MKGPPVNSERQSGPESPGREDRRRRLDDALRHAGHYLPAQAPLEVFVHHNTLHAFQHLPFHQALSEAAHKLGASCYLPESAYRAAWREGRIAQGDLSEALSGQFVAGSESMAEALSPAAWPASLPPVAELRLLIQLYGLRETSPAGLSFLLNELGAGRRFRPDLPQATRERLMAGLVRTTPFFGLDPEQALVTELWETCLGITQRLEGRAAAPPPPLRFPRELLIAIGDEDPNELVHPVLIPLCAAFLDRGQAHWPMPCRQEGFYAAWRHIAVAGRALRPAWERRLGQLIRGQSDSDPSAAVLSLIDELGIPASELEDFIEQLLLQLPSWAGLFQRLEGSTLQVGLSTEAPKVTLIDFVAVRLFLDVLAYQDIAERIGYHGPLRELLPYLRRAPRLAAPLRHGPFDTAWLLFNLAQLAGLDAAVLRSCRAEVLRALFVVIEQMNEETRLRIWHDAYERHYRDELLSAVVSNVAAPRAAPAARLQVICCIDDRMESFRRQLEENHPDVETFGAAGFFNLAIAFQGIDDPSTFPLCPVVVQPQHLIAEEPAEQDTPLFARRQRRRRRWHWLDARFDRASRSLLLGSVLTALAGFVATVPLLLNVFLPKFAARLRRFVTQRLLPEVRTQLSQLRSPSARSAASVGLYTGFSIEEKAARVGSLLENLGLTQSFAPMVVVLGHDSSSVNNPHFAAYSCGACGGRSGGPNARLFARMANRPEVRELLRQRGIEIPATTLFVGGVHDTCADAITLYEEAVPQDRRDELEALRAVLKDGLLRQAHERSRRFASASANLSLEQARAHVEERAADLSQARPELGHATNASCLVGRRALSRGVFLDRRAFLVSYDPTKDASGAILERLLLAVGPVCSGINLEYYFSTVDNERLGAGTKLPHNVTGLIAVMNGAMSDLRTGLPKQMIEIHEPVRLQLVMDASPETVLAIMARQPSVAELIQNEWVQAITITPASHEVHVYQAGQGFLSWTPPPPDRLPPVPRARSSADWYYGKRSFVPPALIDPAAAPQGGVS